MKTEAKWLILGIVMATGLLMTSGCAFRLLNSDVTTETTTVPTNGVPTTVTVQNEVTAASATLLVNSEVDKANVKWGDVEIGVGGLSLKGDSASIKTLTDGVVAGAVAYFSGGSSAVAPAVSKIVTGPLAATISDSLLKSLQSSNTIAPAVK